MAANGNRNDLQVGGVGTEHRSERLRCFTETCYAWRTLLCVERHRGEPMLDVVLDEILLDEILLDEILEDAVLDLEAPLRFLFFRTHSFSERD